MRKIKLISEFFPRSYQESIFLNSLDKNTLVVLPTGLGKTIIALMLAVYYFNKNNKKVLFLAPTKPLVEQQKLSFENFFENKEEFNFQVLTGLVSPKKRIPIYEEADFIFSTPQLIENDIINNIIDIKIFGFVIIDEVHRAKGGYAYNFLAEEFEKSGAKILGLSASPGTTKEEIMELIESMKIEHIEIKKYDDLDVKEYINKTHLEKIQVEMPLEFQDISSRLNFCFEKKIKKLQELNIFQGKNSSNISKKNILDLQMELRTKIASGENYPEIWKAISIAAGLLKLMHGIELFESQEISASYNFFNNFFRDGGDNSKAAEDLRFDIDFRDAYQIISNLYQKGVLHPKILELRKLVYNNIFENPDLKIIIFAQYRDSAQKIVSELSKIKEIKPCIFVGQSKKGDTRMSQKEQKKVLDQFRDGTYNILVSTSVGEEGLDIPKVDMVIFYEPIPSAIRTIQRVGRTGRFNKGSAYVLQTKGSRDIAFSHIANAKEKRMYLALDSIKADLNLNNNDNKFNLKKDAKTNLSKFLKEEDNNEKKDNDEEFDKNYLEKNDKNLNNHKQDSDYNKNKEIILNDKENILEDKKNISNYNINSQDNRYLIYIDSRENSDLIKEFYKEKEFKVVSNQLTIGDIVINDNIAIERKSKKDFVNSIIDKRLFSQLIDLAKNYSRPILIIEGNENIYLQRNISPEAIRSSIASIAIDMRMPIIFTESIEDTKNYILSICKRAFKEKKDISFGNKKSSSEKEELEKFISNIPKINIVSAKQLLENFSSIENLVNSSKKDLENSKGIGKKRAEFLYDFFRREYNQ